MQNAIGQGDVSNGDAGSVDSYTIRVAAHCQDLIVEGEQAIAINQARSEPCAANDMAPQYVWIEFFFYFNRKRKKKKI